MVLAESKLMKKHNVDGKHYIKLWLVYVVNYEQRELIKIKSSLEILLFLFCCRPQSGAYWKGRH